VRLLDGRENLPIRKNGFKYSGSLMRA
jgi:hypothetical protein